MRRLHFVYIAVTLFLLILVSACSGAAAPAATTTEPTEAPLPAAVTEPSPEETPMSEAEPVEKEWEDFDPANFSDPTNIDNPWFPLKPGMRYTYEGETEEAGVTVPHRVVTIVTDLTKEIGGVKTVVIWDQDFSEGELVETELAFFAQDDDGNVWRLGEYPEVYELGELVENPTWIHGLKGAQAGIIMTADPQMGTPSYSQGWAPAVDFTDRGQVDQMGQKVCVPLDCYEDVLVIAETSKGEPEAFQLKYYAQNVGNVSVGWRGADATKEKLELVEAVELSSTELAEAHAQALELEERAYKNSKEVYALTSPSE